MKLKLLSLLVILGLMVNVGCTSSNDDEAADVETAEAVDAELEGEEYAEGEEVAEGEEALEGEEFAEETDDFAADEEVVADTGEEEISAEDGDLAATDELPAESLEDSSALVAEDGTQGSELADGSITETMPAEEGVFDSASSEMPAEDYASTDTSYSDTSYSSDTASSDTMADAGGYTEEAPKYIPVKKIVDVPFNKNGILVNTVYLARPGDDLASISQKIFGADQTAALLQANPNLSNGVKTGDKVYYNSPKRPQDTEKMLTYYEDSGAPAQSYVAKAGDNIRVVSKNLLGDEHSWKEVWATNLAVDSKDEIAEGTELRYWPEGAAPVEQTVAAVPEPEPVPEAPQMPEPVAETPVAAADTTALPQDDFALPDDMANAAGTIAANEPPPPPPPPQAPQKSVASNDEKDLTFMLSAGGLLLVGVGVLLGIIKKGRSRKMSMNTHTQI